MQDRTLIHAPLNFLQGIRVVKRMALPIAWRLFWMNCKKIQFISTNPIAPQRKDGSKMFWLGKSLDAIFVLSCPNGLSMCQTAIFVSQKLFNYVPKIVSFSCLVCFHFDRL
jgi:hypothetical protein